MLNLGFWVQNFTQTTCASVNHAKPNKPNLRLAHVGLGLTHPNCIPT